MLYNVNSNANADRVPYWTMGMGACMRVWRFTHGHFDCVRLCIQWIHTYALSLCLLCASQTQRYTRSVALLSEQLDPLCISTHYNILVTSVWLWLCYVNCIVSVKESQTEEVCKRQRQDRKNIKGTVDKKE